MIMRVLKLRMQCRNIHNSNPDDTFRQSRKHRLFEERAVFTNSLHIRKVQLVRLFRHRRCLLFLIYRK